MKQVKGYEGRYSVSKDGSVYSEISKKFLKPQVDHNGYLYVNLYDSFGKMKSIKVHRLVASAYIENTNNKPQVNHKDGNKKNNNVDNLEWATKSENQVHAWDNGLQSKSKKNSQHAKNLMLENNKKKRKIVLQFDLDMNLIAEYNSVAEASNTLFGNVNYVSDISKCCRGKIKTCKGFVWRYKQI
jgi:HNH endonuclease/NUMOD4 motif